MEQGDNMCNRILFPRTNLKLVMLIMSRIFSSHSRSFNTLEESRLLTTMNNNAYECTNNNFNYLYEYKTFQEQNITFLCCFILPAHLGEFTFHILLQTFELSCNFICFVFFFFFFCPTN